jgi:hypothetical protein
MDNFLIGILADDQVFVENVSGFDDAQRAEILRRYEEATDDPLVFYDYIQARSLQDAQHVLQTIKNQQVKYMLKHLEREY